MAGPRMWTGALCALVTVGIALGACGGSDEPEDDGSDFAAQADQICIDTQSELVATTEELGPVTSDEDVTERIELFIPIRAEATEELAALEPPEEDKAAFEEYVALREEQTAGSEKELSLRQEGDLKAAEQLGADAEALEDEMQAAAEEAGLRACARILPDEDVEQIEQTILTLETSDDPALCTETMTEAGVESLFGGLEKCERTQETLKPEDLADTVTFEEVTGVEGVTASATGTVEGGALDGDHAQYEMIAEDGIYKVNTVFAAPPSPEDG